jgi:enamine deaminase RidA (YjgF/YER057c/UK114 family)
MTGIEHFNVIAGMRPATGYSHGVAARGRFVAIAGQVAMGEDGELVGAGDPMAQVERVFENLSRVLSAAGASFGDVIKFGVFVTDIGILPIVREVRDRHVGANPPASTAVQVGALFQPGYLVEIDALAVVPDADRALV